MAAQFKKGAENLTPGEIHLAGCQKLRNFERKFACQNLRASKRQQEHPLVPPLPPHHLAGLPQLVNHLGVSIAVESFVL